MNGHKRNDVFLSVHDHGRKKQLKRVSHSKVEIQRRFSSGAGFSWGLYYIRSLLYVRRSSPFVVVQSVGSSWIRTITRASSFSLIAIRCGTILNRPTECALVLYNPHASFCVLVDRSLSQQDFHILLFVFCHHDYYAILLYRRKRINIRPTI